MVGMILADRYEIIKEIGSGGMANVYLAKCRVLNRLVAIKVLKTEFANDREFLHRFNKEAQSAAAINSPNIVNVYDVGHDGDIHYIVMEYVEGKTLKEYIDAHGMLSWQETVEYAIQICSALDKAHKHGVIHRDIKPQNIILTNDGMLKVTDFGIARATSAETVNMGESTMGSVHYFSPEQARGGFTDEKSDIYSLGIVMYELVTGRLPFNGETPIAIAIKHIQENPVSPKEYNVSVPLSVEAVILKAMSKEQSKRYQTAEEMLADLYACVGKGNEAAYVPQIDKTIKFDGVKDEDIKQSVSDETALHREDSAPPRRNVNKNGNAKKTEKTPEDKKATVKAVILAVVTAFAILAAVGVLALSMLGGCTAKTEVPELVGELYEDVIEKYADEDFVITVEQYVESDKYGPGYITWQSPSAGKTSKSLKEIKVKVVKDNDSFIMSDFENLTVSELKKALADQIRELGITVDEVEEENAEVDEGKITRTYPPAGSKVEKGTAITVYISKGGTEMPDLTGATLNDAKKTLSKLGLQLGEVTPSDADGNYVVIYQSEDPGVSVSKGTYIDLELRKTDTEPGTSGGTTTGDSPASPDPAEKVTSKVITVMIPQSEDTTNIRVVQDGVTIHDKTHSRRDGSVDVTVTGTGTAKVDIYYNGVYNSTVTVEL